MARLAAVEQEFIRDHLRGSLPWTQRRRFQRRLRTSSDLRQKTSAGRALIAALSARSELDTPVTPSRRARLRFPPFGKFSRVVVAAAIVLCAFGVLLWDDVKSHRSMAVARAELSRVAANHGLVFSFLLSPGAARADARPHRFLVSGSEGRIRFQMEIPGPMRYLQYRGYLNSVDGGYEVWSGNAELVDARSPAGMAAVDLPVAILSAGDYVMFMRGLTPSGLWQEVESYSFGVIRR